MYTQVLNFNFPHFAFVTSESINFPTQNWPFFRGLWILNHNHVTYDLPNQHTRRFQLFHVVSNIQLSTFNLFLVKANQINLDSYQNGRVKTKVLHVRMQCPNYAVKREGEMSLKLRKFYLIQKHINECSYWYRLANTLNFIHLLSICARR